MPIAHPNQTFPFRSHRHSLAHVGALPALASNRLFSFAASSIVGVFLLIFLYAYEQAVDSGHYIDEYTVLREIALGIGRVAMLLFLVAVTSIFSIGASFFVAAVVSLGVNSLVDYKAVE